MTLEDLMTSDSDYQESAIVKTEQNAEVLTVEKFNEKILHNTDRCYFVMNCSKNCPACSYQEPYF